MFYADGNWNNSVIKTDYETLKKELIKNGFQEKEQYIINDTYLVNENVLKANLWDLFKRNLKYNLVWN